MESHEMKNEQLLSYWRKFAGKIATGERGCPTTFDAFKAGWEACAAFYDGEVDEKFELFREEVAVPTTTADEIYAAYPRKVGKTAALKAINKALSRMADDEDAGETGTSPDILLGTVQSYAAAVAKWPESERQFVPHPATWFGQGRYMDDRSTWIRQPKVANRPQMRLHESQIKCS